MEAASAQKAEGNAQFKAGDKEAAVGSYTACLASLGALPSTEAADVAATVNTNLAMVQFKRGDMEAAVAASSAALSHDGGRAKALYWRALAFEALDRLGDAFTDLRRLLAIEPKNAAGVTAARRIAEAVKEQARDPVRAAARAVEALRGADSTESAASVVERTEQALGSSSKFVAEFIAAGGVPALQAAVSHTPTAVAAFRAMLLHGAGMEAATSPELLEYFFTLCSTSGAPAVVASACDVVGDVCTKVPPESPVVAATLNHIKAQLSGNFAMLCLTSVLQLAARLVAVEAIAHVAVSTGCLQAAVRHANSLVTSARVAASVVITQCLRALLEGTTADTTPAERTRNRHAQARRKALQELAISLCAPAIHKPDDESDVERVASRMGDVERAAVVVRSLFLLDVDLGLWAMEQDGVVPAVCALSFSSSAVAQSLCSDVLGDMAGTEKGRGLINSEVRDTLQRLLDGRIASVRSGAALTLSKLQAGTKAGDIDAGKAAELLATVCALVRDGASVAVSDMSGMEVSARGVEALSCLAVHTSVKNTLSKDAATLAALLRIAETLTRVAGKPASGNAALNITASPTMYGVASVLLNVTLSLSAQQEAKLREMDISREQWEEFQKLTLSATGGNAGVDPPEAVESRVRLVLDGGALKTLTALTSASERMAALADERSGRTGKGARPGEPTRECVAQTFLNLTTHEWTRGQVVQAGGLRTLVALARDNTAKGKGLATQALSQVLITTNAALIPDSQVMDTIGPLVAATRADSQLQQFEACMALTNLASIGSATKRRIIAEKGLSALEYCQFSDHDMVRRAGTEALANLAVTEEGAALVCGKRVKLWLALSRDWEADELTASAAAGAIAMATTDDPEAAAKVVDAGGISTMFEVIMSGKPGLQHRAVVALENLVPAVGGKAKLLEPLVLDGDDDAAAAGGVESKTSEAPSGSDVTGLALLTLLARGADVASMAGGGDGGAGGMPAVVQETATRILGSLK